MNVLSALSWFSTDGATAYSAAKAAEWSLTNGVRIELTEQGEEVRAQGRRLVGAIAATRWSGVVDGPVDRSPRRRLRTSSALIRHIGSPMPGIVLEPA